MESALMTTPPSFSASANASADLPLAVGPAMRMMLDTSLTVSFSLIRIARHVLRGNANIASGAAGGDRGVGGQGRAISAPWPRGRLVGLGGSNGYPVSN